MSASFGITLLVFALVQGPELGWGSAAILAAPTGGLLLVVFVVIEPRSRDPLHAPGAVRQPRSRHRRSDPFLFWATFGSVLYFLTLYLQNVHG